MKKIYFSTFLILTAALFLGANTAWTKEEAPSPSLTLSPFDGKSAMEIFPFEFLVTPGKWSQAKRGEIFTTGNYGADFVLPSLKEELVPVVYPQGAVREGWEGTFVIAVEILTSGEVGRWEIIQTTGYSLLDKAATAAIRQWRFHPATEGGKPIVSCVQIPIHFQLKEASRR